jgi:hypothetical protein
MNLTFDAQGAAFDCNATNTGNYLPPTGYNMSNLNGFNPAGNWQFGFKDVVAGNAGTINSIGLEICSQVLELLSDSRFEFTDFSLYPNPNNGNFTLQFNANTSSKIKVEIFDLSGRRIYDKEYLTTGIFNENIELPDASAGVYLVNISDGNKKVVKKININ